MRQRTSVVACDKQSAIIGPAMHQARLHPFDDGPWIKLPGFRNSETSYATHGYDDSRRPTTDRMIMPNYRRRTARCKPATFEDRSNPILPTFPSFLRDQRFTHGLYFGKELFALLIKSRHLWSIEVLASQDDLLARYRLYDRTRGDTQKSRLFCVALASRTLRDVQYN